LILGDLNSSAILRTESGSPEMCGGTMHGEDGLWIGVLGPLCGIRDGVVIRMPRGRSGVLLAVLAMSAGRPVGVGRLAELIWPEEQPEWVRPSVQSLVARVRGLVPDVVVTAAGGYLLDVDPGHVDLLRFRRLVRAANGAADPGAAAGLLEQALGLWRGEPLGDLRSSALYRDVIPGLVEERLTAVQQHAELDLAAGRNDRVIAELQALIGQYQLREPLWGQLIRALRAAGRPAEAIQQYHRVREILATELGVDPSADLQDLYRQLLEADQRDVTLERSPGATGPEPGDRSQARTTPAVPRPEAQANPTPRQSPAGRVGGVPHQLPADTRVFAGRRAELTRLLGLAEAGDGAGGPGTVVISAIDGMAGIGNPNPGANTHDRYRSVILAGSGTEVSAYRPRTAMPK
jgi:DNA-binding SARP family transcriptional activator